MGKQPQRKVYERRPRHHLTQYHGMTRTLHRLLRTVEGHARAITLGMVLVASIMTTPSSLEAQGETQATHERGPWWTLWSTPTPHDRVLVGMITTHLYNLDELPTNNNAIGAIYRGVLGATFITTHGPRGFVAAIERSWFEGTLGPARTMFGFRTGLVYGYDERLFGLAGKTPILPYGQPVALIRLGPVSLDFTYTWVVVSLTAGISFW